MWARDAACEEVVLGCWTGRINRNFKELASLVRICEQALATWNKEEYGNLQHCIKHKQMQLEGLMNKVQKSQDSIVVEECKRQLKELLDKEEVVWKQRSKCQWLKERS